MKHLIGLVYVYRRYCPGKSGQLSLMRISQVHVEFRVRPRLVCKARFQEKSLSSSTEESVPQTDTGDQVE